MAIDETWKTLKYYEYKNTYSWDLEDDMKVAKIPKHFQILDLMFQTLWNFKIHQTFFIRQVISSTLNLENIQWYSTHYFHNWRPLHIFYKLVWKIFNSKNESWKKKIFCYREQSLVWNFLCTLTVLFQFFQFFKNSKQSTLETNSTYLWSSFVYSHFRTMWRTSDSEQSTGKSQLRRCSSCSTDNRRNSGSIENSRRWALMNRYTLTLSLLNEYVSEIVAMSTQFSQSNCDWKPRQAKI